MHTSQALEIRARLVLSQVILGTGLQGDHPSTLDHFTHIGLGNEEDEAGLANDAKVIPERQLQPYRRSHPKGEWVGKITN